MRVRNLEQREIESHEHRGPEINLLDDAFVFSCFDPVADLERSVHDDDARADEVSGDVSQRKRDRETGTRREGEEYVHVRLPHPQQPREKNVRDECLEQGTFNVIHIYMMIAILYT